MTNFMKSLLTDHWKLQISTHQYVSIKLTNLLLFKLYFYLLNTKRKIAFSKRKKYMENKIWACAFIYHSYLTFLLLLGFHFSDLFRSGHFFRSGVDRERLFIDLFITGIVPSRWTWKSVSLAFVWSFVWRSTFSRVARGWERRQHQTQIEKEGKAKEQASQSIDMHRKKLYILNTCIFRK